ncbi:hypothetical protein M9H77_30996 [Catharanthus roseus]|uniref:Uncharacterized protein n=1 Tax=Catharanthus roseus TaxID=4058 RepID=A0ACB9ZZN1_CATRO|nr:hypothetical protein M9H77_30996 [Catharanthus roseus]
MTYPSHRWTYREGTLVDEPSRTTSSSSSSSSSYSLREIVPEREPIPVIDLFDDESVEGPEMAPVAPGIGLGTSLEEDPRSQSPNHAEEAMSESSQNRQSEPMREATPRPEQATHKLLDFEEWQRIGGLELPKLRHLRTNHRLGTIFKKNSKRNTYLVGFVSNGRTSFSN